LRWNTHVGRHAGVTSRVTALEAHERIFVVWESHWHALALGAHGFLLLLLLLHKLLP
jgi:hypothetical protein